MGLQKVRPNSATEHARTHRNGSMKIYSTLPKQIDPWGTFQAFLTFRVLSITHPLSDAPSLGLCEHPAPICAPLFWCCPGPRSSLALPHHWFFSPTGSLGLSVPPHGSLCWWLKILPRQRPSSPQSQNQVARQLSFSTAFSPPAPTFPASAGDINSFPVSPWP